MKSWIAWTIAICAALAIYTLWQDATERVKAANAEAWYRQQERSQSESSDSKRAEWRAFKECVATGERVRNCLEGLE